MVAGMLRKGLFRIVLIVDREKDKRSFELTKDKGLEDEQQLGD